MDAPIKRLITILDEKITEEKNGLESYDNIIKYIRALNLPRHIEREILYYLYKIYADEEIHVDTLTVARDKINKTFK